jgi:hypothetical protein
VAVTLPVNWKASLLFSAWFWRCRTLPVTASTISVYANAEPRWTSTTLASKTGRTEPSARARARSRTCCSCAKPGTVSRVQPPLVFEVMASRSPVSRARPTLAAARAHAWSGESSAAAGVPVVRVIDEET